MISSLMNLYNLIFLKFIVYAYQHSHEQVIHPGYLISLVVRLLKTILDQDNVIVPRKVQY